MFLLKINWFWILMTSVIGWKLSIKSKNKKELNNWISYTDAQIVWKILCRKIMMIHNAECILMKNYIYSKNINHVITQLMMFIKKKLKN